MYHLYVILRTNVIYFQMNSTILQNTPIYSSAEQPPYLLPFAPKKYTISLKELGWVFLSIHSLEFAYHCK